MHALLPSRRVRCIILTAYLMAWLGIGPHRAYAEEPAAATDAPDAVTTPAASHDVEGDAAPEEAPAPVARIIVRWGIETAVDNFGYNIYRTDNLEDEESWQRINRRVLPGVGSSSQPTVFQYLDTNVGDDLTKVWHYRVEEVALDGTKTIFTHPVSGQSVLSGRPRLMTPEEREAFADGPYRRQVIERTEAPATQTPAEAPATASPTPEAPPAPAESTQAN
jgi:hypothetical protein